MLDDEQARLSRRLPPPPVAHYRPHDIRVERAITDNGSCYRSAVYAPACKTLGIRHLPHLPLTGRAPTKGGERLIRTMLGGWERGPTALSAAT